MLVFRVRNAPLVTQVIFACVYNDPGEHGYHNAAMMEWGFDNVIALSPKRKYVSDPPSNYEDVPRQIVITVFLVYRATRLNLMPGGNQGPVQRKNLSVPVQGLTFFMGAWKI